MALGVSRHQQMINGHAGPRRALTVVQRPRHRQAPAQFDVVPLSGLASATRMSRSRSWHTVEKRKPSFFSRMDPT